MIRVAWTSLMSTACRSIGARRTGTPLHRRPGVSSVTAVASKLDGVAARLVAYEWRAAPSAEKAAPQFLR